MSHLPHNLVKDLRRGRVIPFVGAGVSRSVMRRVQGEAPAPAFPSWRELLIAACDRLRIEGKEAHAGIVSNLLDLRPTPYLDAARYARDGLSQQWFSFLKEHLDPSFEVIVPEGLTLPSLIWRLSDFVITTNYDRVLRWACPSPSRLQEWDIEAPHGFVQLLRGELAQPTVWHLHGSLDKITDLILTPDGYTFLYPSEGTRLRYEAALVTLRNLLLSHTFLFIGFSLDDEDFGNQLRWASHTFENTAGPHYILLRRADVGSSRAYLQDLRVEIVEFDEFGAPLLQELNLLLEARDDSLSTRYPGNGMPRHNLPRSNTTEVIGRTKELQFIADALRQGGIVSIDGNAGVGKTTLAIEAAQFFANQPLDGADGSSFAAIVWISAKTAILTADGPVAREQSITSLQSVLSALAHVLGRYDILNHPEDLTVAQAYAALSQQRTLLVFDNFETVQDRSIITFLKETPTTTAVLVTSRVFVDVKKRCHLSELSREDAEALILAECKERQIAPDSELIAKLHAFAGGSPLAIVWAVAQIAIGSRPDMLSTKPAQADLVEFLFGQQRSVLQQHPSAVRLLLCLALFPSGADLDDLLEVAGVGAEDEGLRLLRLLSLIEHKGTHLHMLPVTKRLLVPELESDALISIDLVQRDIGRVMRRFLQREEAAIWEVGSHRSSWWQQRDNVLWALDHSRATGDEELELTLLAALYAPMLMHGELSTYVGLVENGLADGRWQDDPAGIASIAVRAASVYGHLGDLDNARKLLERAQHEATKLSSIEGGLQNILNFVESLIAVETDQPDADEVLERAIALERDRGVIWTFVGFSGWRSILLCNRERWEEAQSVASEALALAKQQGLFRSVTFVSVPLARALREQGHFAEALRICDEALALADEFAEMHNFAHLCLERGRIALATDDADGAKLYFGRALKLYSGLGLPRGVEAVDKAASYYKEVRGHV